MMNIPVLGLVENMSYVSCPDCGKKIYIFGEGKVEETAAKYVRISAKESFLWSGSAAPITVGDLAIYAMTEKEEQLKKEPGLLFGDKGLECDCGPIPCINRKAWSKQKECLPLF